MVEYSYPGRRISYDVDGTLGFLLNSERLTPDLKGTLTQLPPGSLAGMNADFTGGLYIPGRRFEGTGASFRTYPGIWGEATYPGQQNFVVLFFPDAMRLRGWYANLGILWQNHLNSSSDTEGTTLAYPEFTLEVSHDTTNGQDGSWYVLDYHDANQYFAQDNYANPYETAVAWTTPSGAYWHNEHEATYYNPYGIFTRANPDLDEYIDGRQTGRGWQPLYGGHARNVRAVRLSTSATGPRSSIARTLIQLQLYGEPDVNAGLTRLALVDPVTDVELTMDPSWGDLDFKTGGAISIAVKNMSPVETAENVTVAIGDSSPPGIPLLVYSIATSSTTDHLYFMGPLSPFLEVSLDEVTWADEVTLGDLAPEQTVEVFARLLPPIGWTLPYPYYRDYRDGETDPPVPYVDAGLIGLRFARFTVETEGWV